jgi:hypothetical protein
MRRHLVGIASLLAALATVTAARADWAFRASYYSHDSATGQRVAQFAQPVPAYSRVGGEGYLQSAYRHNETALLGPNDADHIHVVETWGAGNQVRPYGEWLFPYRAGATPYGPWGNPQGPWTLPFDSWSNPYGLLQHSQGYPGNGMPMPNGSAMPYGRAPLGAGANGEYQQPPRQSMPYGTEPGAAWNQNPGQTMPYGGGSAPAQNPPPVQ